MGYGHDLFCTVPSLNPRYGPPTRTDYRIIVENISSRVSWQVGVAVFESTAVGVAFNGIPVISFEPRPSFTLINAHFIYLYIGQYGTCLKREEQTSCCNLKSGLTSIVSGF